MTESSDLLSFVKRVAFELHSSHGSQILVVGEKLLSTCLGLGRKSVQVKFDSFPFGLREIYY